MPEDQKTASGRPKDLPEDLLEDRKTGSGRPEDLPEDRKWKT